MNNLLETLLEEAFAVVALARNSVRRQFEFPQAKNMIKVAIGMRRSGKTYFLYQTINKLWNENNGHWHKQKRSLALKVE